MEYVFIYLLQIFEIVDTIQQSLFIFSIISIIFVILLGFLTKFQYSNYESTSYIDDLSTEQGQSCSKFCKKAIPLLLIITVLFCLMPTKQTLLLMSGVYYGKSAVAQITKSEKIKKVNTIIDLELDRLIKELNEQK